jgi:hypothetical protein
MQIDSKEYIRSRMPGADFVWGALWQWKRNRVKIIPIA